MERQKVVDEYRSMMMKGMGLIPLESNLYKSDLVVILHTIQMIEVDNFWHLKTLGAVLTELWRRRDKEIHEQKDMSMHSTENGKTNSELDCRIFEAYHLKFLFFNVSIGWVLRFVLSTECYRTRKLGYGNLNWPRCSARVTESLALTDGSFCRKQNTLYFR